MNKDKRNNIQLLGTLNNADESGIIANANQIYDANEDKSTQDVSKEHTERIKDLEIKEYAMQTTLENITKTGEASAASNVTYNHSNSKLDATNVQQAVEEVRKRSNYNDGDNIIDFNTIHLITDNPEFVCVAVDVNEKILYGIKTDGQPYFGVGCPQQVKDYIDKQINKILGTDDISSTIDSLKEIEAFLKDFTNSDTLKTLLDTKANKTDVDNINANIANKCDQINADVADKYKKSNPNDSEGNVVDTNTIVSIENNPKFISVNSDSDGKLLESTDTKGNKVFYADVEIKGNINCNSLTSEIKKTLSNFDSKLQVIDGLKNLYHEENVKKVIYNCPTANNSIISSKHQCLGFNDSIEDKDVERKLNYILISYQNQKENSLCYIHVGFLDQRGWWIESDKYAGSISYTKDPKIIKITPNSEITLKYNEFLFLEFLEEPFCFYFAALKSEDYKGFVAATKSSLYNHTVLSARTDYTTLYYWENNYQYIKTELASKKEIQSIESSISNLNTSIANSNIFKDTITGKKYKLKVEKGTIILQSLTFTKIYFAGNSFTYHGNITYWWGNGRGMAASSYNTQYVELVAKIFGATYDKLSYAHIIEEHLNDDNFDVSTITALPSSDYDLVVIQLGENSAVTNETNYKINVSKVINRFKELAPKATLLWITGWSSSTRNPIISQICEQEQIDFLNVGSNTSIGSFRKGDYVLGSNSDMSDNIEEHEVPSTIISHPSDVGMALIANAIGSFYKAENNITLYNITTNNATGGSLSMAYTKWPAKGLVSVWCIPDTGKSLKSFKVTNVNTSNEVETNNHINSDSKLVYTFIMPESDITINTIWE